MSSFRLKKKLLLKKTCLFQRSESEMCQEVENKEWGQSVACNNPREIWTRKQQPNQDSQDEPEAKIGHKLK
jgi:hypothetical protein